MQSLYTLIVSCPPLPSNNVYPYLRQEIYFSILYYRPKVLALLVLESNVLTFREVGLALIILRSYIIDWLLFTGIEEV
jgi:hypothetical protein